MRFTTLALAATLTAGAAYADMVAPADVVFNEDGEVVMSLSGKAGDAAAGMDVYSSRSKGNCVACHVVSSLPDVAFQGNVGPSLDGAADRWTEGQLRSILVNSKATFDGTVMPAYYRVDGFTRPGNAYTGKAPEGPLDPLLSAQQIEDVVAFLMTLKEE